MLSFYEVGIPTSCPVRKIRLKVDEKAHGQVYMPFYLSKLIPRAECILIPIRYLQQRKWEKQED